MSIPKKHSALYKGEHDIFYYSIKLYDTSAIPFLIDHLSDTVGTKIKNPCSVGNYTIGDIAFILIDDIESIPLATVIPGFWDYYDHCNLLPIFIHSIRKEFQSKYKNYYYSITRQKILENNRKNIYD